MVRSTKVNPVMAISFQQIAFAIAGNDVAIGMAANQGHLECNSYEGLIAAKLLESLRLLEAGVTLFSERCVKDLTVNRDVCADHLFRSSALAPVLSPRIGYKRASELVRRSLNTGEKFIDILVAEKLLTRDEVAELVRASTRS